MAWTLKSEVNLALTGLRLKQYIVKGMIPHRGQSLQSTIAVFLLMIKAWKTI